MEDRDEVTGPSDAEQAFEGLRAEVAAMRQAVESLPAALKKTSPATPRQRLGLSSRGSRRWATISLSSSSILRFS